MPESAEAVASTWTTPPSERAPSSGFVTWTSIAAAAGDAAMPATTSVRRARIRHTPGSPQSSTLPLGGGSRPA